jgi:Ni/Co efflux regulator RcnB
MYIFKYIFKYIHNKRMRRKLKDRNIRKIYSLGNSLGLTLPREIISELKWRKGQKLVVKKRGKGILISDWD